MGNGGYQFNGGRERGNEESWSCKFWLLGKCPLLLPRIIEWHPVQ